MTDYLLHPKAIEDLEEIWLYSLKNWGITQADKYITELEHRFRWLAQKPLHGRRRNDIESGCFSCLQGSHTIFYRQQGKDIEIARILHQSMDVASHFGQNAPPENFN